MSRTRRRARDAVTVTPLVENLPRPNRKARRHYKDPATGKVRNAVNPLSHSRVSLLRSHSQALEGIARVR